MRIHKVRAPSQQQRDYDDGNGNANTLKGPGSFPFNVEAPRRIFREQEGVAANQAKPSVPNYRNGSRRST